MNKDKVYLSFPADRETHAFLRALATASNKKMPELINEIITDYKNLLIQYANENIEKEDTQT